MLPSTPVEGVPSAPATTKPGQSAASLDRRGSGPAESLRRTGTSTVALTFDDGPDPVQTPKLLDLLEKNGVTATFCLVGKQAKAHPEIVRRIVADGHRLCNHSWDHSLTLGKQDPTDIREDLVEDQRGDPGGRAGREDPVLPGAGRQLHRRLVGTADERGMTSLYWDVDPRDWDHPEDEDDTEHVDRIVAQVQAARPPRLHRAVARLQPTRDHRGVREPAPLAHRPLHPRAAVAGAGRARHGWQVGHQ